MHLDEGGTVTMSQQQSIDPGYNYNYDLYSTSQVGRDPTIDAGSDILQAYKELKKIMVKGQGSKIGHD